MGVASVASEMKRKTSRMPLLMGYAHHHLEATLDILVARRPAADADAHGRSSVPYRASAPARALRLNRRDRAARLLGIAESDQHLVQHHLVQHVMARCAQTFGESTGLAAVARDELREASSPERSQRRVHRDRARTARFF